MATKATGATAPCHAPIGREAFFSIRLTRDPAQAHADASAILSEHPFPFGALAACSDIIAGHGVESVTLADGARLLYVNKGDTYDATLCHVQGRGYFVSSWGDEYEASDRAREEEGDERRCAYCSEWSDVGEPCGACGRDPDTGNPWPEPLRHVRLDNGYTLRTWDSGKTRRGRTRIGYELKDGFLGKTIFSDDEFCPSPCHADDADETLRGLLGFLTLRPGDTDRDYFDAYTPAQREFAASSACELLAYLYSDEGPGAFADVDADDEGSADA